MMKLLLSSAAACAARSPSSRPFLSIARITVSLTPCAFSVTSCSGSNAKIVLSRSMSARITASVTPDRDSSTICSTVTADATDGARTPAISTSQATRGRKKRDISHLFATCWPAGLPKNLTKFRGFVATGCTRPRTPDSYGRDTGWRRLRRALWFSTDYLHEAPAAVGYAPCLLFSRGPEPSCYQIDSHLPHSPSRALAPRRAAVISRRGRTLFRRRCRRRSSRRLPRLPRRLPDLPPSARYRRPRQSSPSRRRSPPR